MRDESADTVLEFLIDLEIALHAVSVPADIIARMVTRAADRLDVSFDTAIFQNYIAADLRSGGEGRVRIKHTPYEPHWNLSRSQQLTDLARGLGDGRIGFTQGRELLAQITAQPALYSKRYVFAGYCVYSAVVAARIGGSVVDAAATLIVGCMGGLIYVSTSSHRSLQLQQCFVAGLCGTPLALLLALALPVHAGKVLFGAVALLLPATAMTIAIHELANDALESGVLRLAYALLRFLMLGFGIGAALSLWQLIAPLPPLEATDPLPLTIIFALLAPGAGAERSSIERARPAARIVCSLIVCCARASPAHCPARAAGYRCMRQSVPLQAAGRAALLVPTRCRRRDGHPRDVPARQIRDPDTEPFELPASPCYAGSRTSGDWL
jgi:uncharacterized membrane protein YjjP (DUF1212 family)